LTSSGHWLGPTLLPFVAVASAIARNAADAAMEMKTGVTRDKKPDKPRQDFKIVAVYVLAQRSE
jgi:hypothetical protein